MKIFSLFIAVLVSASMAFSQTSLQGTVTDADTGEPIIFGTVALYKDGKLITGTETDLDGFYSITEIGPGEYDVGYSYTGHAAKKIAGVIIFAGKTNILDVKMTPGVNLEEATVIYEAPLIEQDNISCGAIFSKEQIKNLPTRDVNALASLGSGMKNETEKKKKPDAPKKEKDISVRGSRPDAVTYYIDGIKSTNSSEEILNRPPPPPHLPSEVITQELPQKNDTELIVSGTLTAGEVHDFSSYDLWQDIADIDLENWRTHWNINPNERYTIQAMTELGQPIADATVKLFSDKKEIIWSARTDNTGRAELWVNSFSDKKENKNLSAEITHNGVTKQLDDLTDFKKGINTIIFKTPCEQPNEIDILFVVDGTGSMGDEIEFLKTDLTDVIEKTKAGLPNLKLNLGSIFYRDIRDEYLTQQSPFSENISQTVNFIKKQKAGGGGDKPEAVEIALDEAINMMPWSESARARLLFLVLDAPPHRTPEILEELKSLSMKAAEKGIRIIPVAGSDTDKSTEYLARSLALLTNGTYTFLSDDSGVGGSHIEPTSDTYEVEKLNELLVRIILQYSEMPDCGNAIVERETRFLNDKKIEKKLGLKIFPNPSSGSLTVKIKMNIEDLYVTDLSGKILARYTDLQKGSTPVNLSNLPNGSYLIRAQIEDKFITERLVILH